VIREDWELLAELARINGELAPLAIRIMTTAPAQPNNSTTHSA